MTLRSDVVRSRDLIACWRELAEERLEYLAEMFESGRWRRYYSEYAFLENIREAKRAVETWRVLSTRRSTGNAAGGISWLAPERPAMYRKTAPRPRLRVVEPVTETPTVARIEEAPSPQALPVVPFIEVLAPERALHGTPDPVDDAFEGRYPFLRHSL